MFKGKLAVLCLVAAALLVVSSTAFAGIIDPCMSTCSLDPAAPVGPPAGHFLAACPQGDAATMAQQGFSIKITVKDGVGNGIPNISPTDFWLDDCDAINVLWIPCGGSASSGADSLTNSAGKTTMSNTTLAASTLTGPEEGPPPIGNVACSNGVIVIVQGSIISTGCPSPTAVCHLVNVRSFDTTGDGLVGLADLAGFAIAYPGGTGFPNTCTDFNGSLVNDLADLAEFALHFDTNHFCQ